MLVLSSADFKKNLSGTQSEGQKEKSIRFIGIGGGVGYVKHF